MKKKMHGFMIGFLLLVGLMMVTAVSASGGLTFSLQTVNANPGEKPVPYFIFEQVAGNQTVGQVQVKNTSFETGTVRLYAVDAATGQTSGIVYAMGNAPKTQVGSWIKLAVEEITLQSGESQIVPFTVAIPEAARAGQHVGAIVAEPVKIQSEYAAQAEDDQAAFHVEVKSRSALAVQINVPGEAINRIDVNGIEIGGQNGVQTLLLNLRNSGTEIVKPTGRIVVTNMAGEQVQGVRFRMDSFLPDTEIMYPIPVEHQALEAGDYSVYLTVQYGPDKAVYEHSLSLTVTEKENIQIFTGRSALESPVDLSAYHNSQPFLSTTLGKVTAFAIVSLVIAAVGFLAFSLNQSKKSQKRSTLKPQSPQLAGSPIRQQPLHNSPIRQSPKMPRHG